MHQLWIYVMMSVAIDTYLKLGIITAVYSSSPKPRKMSFKSPELTEEDERSDHMPSYLKCDACQAIAYQLEQGFKKAEDKLRNKRQQLTESEVLEVTEQLLTSGFETYGIKSISNNKHLTGPGLDAENVAGIVQMGGKWPKRLRSLCGLYLEEVGEDVIYNIFRSQTQSIAEFLCKSKHGEIERQCKSNVNTIKEEL